ncbi:MAG: pantetheine-phosphate adenylyltransferase [Pseudomonadota bacterium]
MSERVGIYPGSFDPVTYGHLDIIERSSRLFDRLVLAIGLHHTKKALLNVEERAALLEAEAASVCDGGCRIEIVTFDDLVVEAALRHRAKTMVRGIRDGTDFDYEMQLFGMNRRLQGGVDTLFLPAESETRHIAASIVRQIGAMGGDVTGFVPPRVAEAIAKALA